MNDAVNNPKHYTSHPSGLQCIELSRHLNFNRGNALKYIWRAERKENKTQDIEKAKWYLLDEFNNMKNAKYKKRIVKQLDILLFSLSQFETPERMSIIHHIIYGDWQLLKGTAYLL
jgi:hypothetical protein